METGHFQVPCKTLGGSLSNEAAVCLSLRENLDQKERDMARLRRRMGCKTALYVS